MVVSVNKTATGQKHVHSYEQGNRTLFSTRQQAIYNCEKKLNYNKHYFKRVDGLEIH
jgi:hypothetical protein